MRRFTYKKATARENRGVSCEGDHPSPERKKRRSMLLCKNGNLGNGVLIPCVREKGVT